MLELADKYFKCSYCKNTQGIKKYGHNKWRDKEFQQGKNDHLKKNQLEKFTVWVKSLEMLKSQWT